MLGPGPAGKTGGGLRGPRRGRIVGVASSGHLGSSKARPSAGAWQRRRVVAGPICSACWPHGPVHSLERHALRHDPREAIPAPTYLPGGPGRDLSGLAPADRSWRGYRGASRAAARCRRGHRVVRALLGGGGGGGPRNCLHLALHVLLDAAGVIRARGPQVLDLDAQRVGAGPARGWPTPRGASPCASRSAASALAAGLASRRSVRRARVRASPTSLCLASLRGLVDRLVAV